MFAALVVQLQHRRPMRGQVRPYRLGGADRVSSDRVVMMVPTQGRPFVVEVTNEAAVLAWRGCARCHGNN